MMARETLVYWDSNPNPGRTESFTHRGEVFCRELGWQFEYVPKGIHGYVDDVLAAWEQGEGPDVIDVWPVWLPRLTASGQLQPLDDAVAAWARQADYDPSHARLSRSFQNTYWFLACDLFLQGTHFRRDLVQAAGLPDPAELAAVGQWDLTAFQTLAQALHNPAAGRVGVTLRGGQGGQLAALNLMVSAAGGALMDAAGRCVLDSPEAVQALAQYAALATEHKVAQATAPTDGYREFAWHFYEGRAGMMLHNDDGVKATQARYLGPERYGNCPLPTGGNPVKQALLGFGAGVRAGTSRSEAAARYACFFVENYHGAPARVGERLPPGPVCAPMRPWQDDHGGLRKPFAALLEADAFFDLPFAADGFAAFWNNEAEADMGHLFAGRRQPAEVAARWAGAFTGFLEA